MYQRKETNKNSYYPAFFCMDLDVQNQIGHLCRVPIDDQTEALFLHEYIHYLQDITTVAGYAHIETVVDQIKWVVMLAKEHKNLKLPLNPESTWGFNMTPNAASLKLSAGDFKIKQNGADIVYSSPEDFTIERQRTPLMNGRTYNPYIVALFKFRGPDGRLHEYRVGEMAISESMAYIIEQHIYPNVLDEPPCFPYHVVRNIIAWKCSRANKDDILVAICDVCLMYPFPGYAFYYLVEFLHQYQGDITPAFIYLYGLGPEMQRWSNTEFWEDNLKTTQNTARNTVNDYFIHPYWENTAQAIRCSMDNALALRLQELPFMLNIMNGGKLSINSTLKKCLSQIGCMTIYTASNDVYHFPPKGTEELHTDPDWFVCLRDLYKILFSSSTIIEQRGMKFIRFSCGLKEWCKKSFNTKNLPDLTSLSQNCIQSPWLHISPHELAQCSFGRLWATYGFDRIKLKV